MLQCKKISARDLHDVKKIINKTSREYDNFCDFCVLENHYDYMKEEYFVNLYFNSNEKKNVKEKVWVECIRGVLYNDIPSIIVYLNLDFEKYVRTDIFKNKDNENIADLIVTYKVSGFYDDTILTCVDYIGGGDIDYAGYESFHQYRFLKYIGKNQYSLGLGNEKVRPELYFITANDKILISKSDKKEDGDELFTINCVKENKRKISVSKFINNIYGTYRNPPLEIENNEIDVEDSYKVVNQLIFILEEEFHIKVSKSSVEFLNRELKKEISYIIK